MVETRVSGRVLHWDSSKEVPMGGTSGPRKERAREQKMGIHSENSTAALTDPQWADLLAEKLVVW